MFFRRKRYLTRMHNIAWTKDDGVAARSFLCSDTGQKLQLQLDGFIMGQALNGGDTAEIKGMLALRDEWLRLQAPAPIRKIDLIKIEEEGLRSSMQE